MSAEQWRPIPGWEGLYEASDAGRIRSLDRAVQTRAGYLMRKPGVVLKGRVHKGYRTVNLARDGFVLSSRFVHRLVAETFLGPLPDGLQTRHLDGDSLNNAAANLAYGTAQENTDDKKRYGVGLLNQCAKGHPFEHPNLYVRPNGKRQCLTCRRDRRRLARAA